MFPFQTLPRLRRQGSRPRSSAGRHRSLRSSRRGCCLPSAAGCGAVPFQISTICAQLPWEKAKSHEFLLQKTASLRPPAASPPKTFLGTASSSSKPSLKTRLSCRGGEAARSLHPAPLPHHETPGNNTKKPQKASESSGSPPGRSPGQAGRGPVADGAVSPQNPIATSPPGACSSARPGGEQPRAPPPAPRQGRGGE